GYEVTGGEVLFDINLKPTDITSLEPDERAKEGIFLAFQYPVEVPGVNNLNFLMNSFNSVLEHQGSQALTEEEFKVYLDKKMQLVGLKEDFLKKGFLDRGVNSGFSGGEKKKNEILQMAVLSPRLSILDETDSGLDIDALKVVSEGVNKLRTKSNAIILITHYQRLLDYIKPDFVHVLSQGKIVKTGGPELAHELEKTGYDGI
ncbi:MAG: Fe-S cluster assembly ATPase SufC, partial [Bdellovibrionales bacterium]|nr:Fe-S cluster assembly ATPase SufC [Bdellovibrionales bacterium]